MVTIPQRIEDDKILGFPWKKREREKLEPETILEVEEAKKPFGAKKKKE